MLELEAAVQKILAALPPPGRERLPLGDSHGRILLESVNATTALPAFDNSAMDGYAVRAADVAAARPEQPIRLRLRGRVAAGENFAGEMAGGECVRLFTGSPLPRGAEAVVMQEDTRVEAPEAGEVLFCEAVAPWENVRLRGAEVQSGATLAEAGEVLTPGKLGLLAAAGIADLVVGKLPRIGLLATGSELRPAGEDLAAGQIYESNCVALAALMERVGGQPQLFPLVPDTLAATRRALETAFATCDAVVTCGGVSVGELDFVKAAFGELGGELEFWKIAVRPGKPFVFGRCGGKFLFGLPGNPVSAFVTFLLLVRPAILRWQGAATVTLPAGPGRLADTLNNPGDRRHFMRVRLDASGQVFSAGLQEAHALRSLAAAEGLVDVPPQTTVRAGTMVTVLRWT